MDQEALGKGAGLRLTFLVGSIPGPRQQHHSSPIKSDTNPKTVVLLLEFFLFLKIFI